MAELSRLPGTDSDVWDWQLRAKCRGEDPNVFFHPSGERDTARKERIEVAKSFCRTCPVIKECADHALSVREPYGIWGGMSEDEREKVLKAS